MQKYEEIVHKKSFTLRLSFYHLLQSKTFGYLNSNLTKDRRKIHDIQFTYAVSEFPYFSVVTHI